MAYQSLQECLDAIEQGSIKAFTYANKAFNHDTYEETLILIRKQLERTCKAIIFEKDAANALAIIGKEALNNLINVIDNKNWFSNNNTDNWGKVFHEIRKTTNSAAHDSNYTITYTDLENVKVDFRRVINMLYSTTNRTIPRDLQDAMNGALLDTNTCIKQARLYAYRDKLRHEYLQPVLNEEGITLQDLYIEPDIHFWKKSLIASKPFDDNNPFDTQKYTLHNFANQLVKGELDKTPLQPQNARLLLLLGYAGQGKTSFCKRLLYDLLPKVEAENTNADALLESCVFLVRLRDIESVQNLFNNPLHTLFEHINNHIDSDIKCVKNSDVEKSLLILDGLDELAMREHSSLQAIEAFCKELLRVQETKPELRIILTARYGYVDLEKLVGQPLIVAQLARLSPEQQSGWLTRYTAQKPDITFQQADLDKINNSDNQQFQHLRELIDQPILLHLVALSGLDINTSNTRAAIYTQLFDKLTARAWSKRGQIKILEGLTDAQPLREYVREIAFAIYTSEYEYMRKTDLEKLPASTAFMQQIRCDDNANASEALKHLMVAFYMQEVNKHSEDTDTKDRRQYAIEFLHKSLQEYLVAERIWNELQTFGDKVPRTSKYTISEANEALKLVWEQFGQKTLSAEIENYLTEIIQQDEHADKALIFERMMYFAPALLEKQFLYEIKPSQPLHAALDTFRGYWVVLAALEFEQNTVLEECKKNFISLLKFYTTYRENQWNLAGIDLVEVKLSHITLPNSDLSHTDFSISDLDNAYFNHSDFSYANLENVDFEKTELRYAIFIGTNLKEAFLIDSDCQEANFYNADLTGANLTKANLQDVYFANTNLQNANLTGTNLTGANLMRANITRTILSRADLSNAIFDTDQLRTVMSLRGVKGLDKNIMKQLKAEGYGHLFEK